MAEPLALATPGEPLGLWIRPCDPPENFGELCAARFEFTSRGDRVPGRLLGPPGPGDARPLVLLQDAGGAAGDAAHLDAVAGAWVRSGVAVARIAPPLHGERADAKLRACLEAELAAAAPSSPSGLAVEFARQAVVDQQRALDALAGLPEIDGGRVAYVGFGLDARVGALFCGLDPRPCAAVLGRCGAGLGPPPIDPARYVAAIAPRPVLLVQAEGDERVPRTAADALFAAAREPKQSLWFDASHTDLPDDVWGTIWRFVSDQLGLASGSG